MEERGSSRPPWLPAARPDAGPPALPGPPSPPPPGAPGPPEPPGERPRPRFDWRRFIRSPRGAVGIAALVAALLLWPFAGLSWIPWLIGFAALLVLRVLRLDGPLRGWDLPLAGLVVVVGLMVSTTPWAWALAVSIGVLLAGLAQLPRWRLAAVGLVLCLVSGAGFAVSSVREAQESAADFAAHQAETRANLGAPRPGSVLPLLLNRIALASPGAVCDNLLSEQAGTAFAESLGQPDCVAAVGVLSARVTNRDLYAEADAPSAPAGDGLTVDACAMRWPTGEVAGPQLGRLTIAPIAPSRYVVAEFRPC
ncbi:hypothetical protein BJF78_29150 [Pseudonocardia sp. CNS-139]|nr:hypothetical protein BJF78_29150 [Pseudonocardia sp. CNS-139]